MTRPDDMRLTLHIPIRSLRSELRTAGLGLNHVDQGRRISPAQCRSQDSKFLFGTLVQRRAIQTGLPCNGLQVTKLSLRSRLIRSNGGHRSGFLPIAARVSTRSRGRLHRGVDDSTHGGAKLKVRTELRPETERGKSAANRFGFGFLQVVSEITG